MDELIWCAGMFMLFFIIARNMAKHNRKHKQELHARHLAEFNERKG